MPETKIEDPSTQGETPDAGGNTNPAKADSGTDTPAPDQPANPDLPPQAPPYQRPYWLEGGPPNEPVAPRPPSDVSHVKPPGEAPPVHNAVLSAGAEIRRRLRDDAAGRRLKKRSASPRRTSLAISRLEGILAAMDARAGRHFVLHNPWRKLRLDLAPGLMPDLTTDPSPPPDFDPLISLAVTLDTPLPRVFIEAVEDDYGYTRQALPAILIATECAYDPLPFPAESPAQDLIARYEAAYKALQGALDKDPAGLTVASVRAFLEETGVLDLALDEKVQAYLETYAPAAETIIGAYLQQKNGLESLLAIGGREVKELAPGATELETAYHTKIAQLQWQLEEVKKAFVNFVFKALAVVSTHGVLKQVLASRRSTMKTLLTALTSEASQSKKLAAFLGRCEETEKTTAALIPEPSGAEEFVHDPIPANLLTIRALLDTYYAPVFLTDAITENGLTINETPDPARAQDPSAQAQDPSAQAAASPRPPQIQLDPDKVLEIKGVHLQAMKTAGYRPSAWEKLIAKSGKLGHELGLISRLAREALFPYIRNPKRSTSHPAPPDPQADIASEPRQ